MPIYDIQDLKKIAKREGIRIAVIAVPAPSAQHVLDLVVAAGIKAVLNFSPGALQVPPDVKLKSVDLTVSLESLSFFSPRATAIGRVRRRRAGQAGHAELSHVDARGRVKMVDVGDKPVTSREAVARGIDRDVARGAAARSAPARSRKGDPLQTARLAGILAAKQTSSLIPLCHPLPLSSVNVELTPTRARLRHRSARPHHGARPASRWKRSPRSPSPR